MHSIRLTTDRLELVAGNLELSQAELADRARFARLLDAQVAEWPPPLNDEQSMRWMRDYYAQNPDASGWAVWYFVLRGDREGERVAMGNGGFKGRPAPDGSVEVGYSVLERYQRQGYAGEALRALLGWAFDHSQVTRVLAETLPELAPSIRLLEKNGFRYMGPGSEEGVIRYELTRQEFGREAKQPNGCHTPGDTRPCSAGALRWSVTYVLTWELADAATHGQATRSGLELFYKEFRRCLVTAPKIILGERIQ